MTCYSPPTCCLRRLKDPLSLDNTTLNLDVHQIIFNKYFKIISLMTLKLQKTLRDWEKLVTFLSHKTLKTVNVILQKPFTSSESRGEESSQLTQLVSCKRFLQNYIQNDSLSGNSCRVKTLRDLT